MISNKRGQTLILFIILIPLILGVMAVVVDVGLIVSKSSSLKETTRLVVKDSLNNDLSEEEIKELFVKNKIEIDSIFGAIIGLKKYTIKIDIKGYKDNNKIVID